MHIHRVRFIVSIAVFLSFLSGIATAVNALFYQYPGNNYFPPNTFFMAVTLVLLYLGFLLQMGSKSKPAAITKELIYFYLMMVILTFTTNAIQYTPFPTIDRQIFAFETAMHINIGTILSWTTAHPILKHALELIYDSLPYQMIYIPLFIILMGQVDAIRQYYFFMLFSALLGFSFYYFFPTSAPASIIDNPYFSNFQKATNLKFSQIHHHIPPTTIDGGMISFPSFHAIWAWFCLYLIRGWPVIFFILLIINMLLTASCVLLGWHYPLDIIGSIIIIVMTHYLYGYWQNSTSEKRTLEPCVPQQF